MNPFVNLGKRGIQLPKGAKDLSDMLKKSTPKPKCEYCGEPSVIMHYLGLEDTRWCAACIRDLKEFASMQDFNFVDGTIDAEFISRHRDDMQRKQDDFMREHIKQRKALL